MQLKLYIAGKVSPNSHFGTHDWRDAFCVELEKKTGLEIKNLDPAKSQSDLFLDENNSKLMVGRDSYMIRMADVILVNLTDDISVGGSHDMLIAKYYKKYLIGLAPKEGKFNKSVTTLGEREYKNWIHPFVLETCDALVEDIDQLAVCLKEFIEVPPTEIKDIDIFEQARQYYEEKFYPDDTFLHS
ncbi:MAG: hypothetical protein WCV86_04360 [Patescibacteria group bacterium]|jgi:hypothetical protein